MLKNTKLMRFILGFNKIELHMLMVKIEYRYVFWERKLVNRMKMGTLFLFCLNIFFFLHCTSEATYMFSRSTK